MQVIVFPLNHRNWITCSVDVLIQNPRNGGFAMPYLSRIRKQFNDVARVAHTDP
jgi:hypothetical protein